MVFCNKCHGTIHKISKKENISVKRATVKFLSNHRKVKNKKRLDAKEDSVIKEILITPEEPENVKTLKAIHEATNQKLVNQMNKLKERFAQIKREQRAELKKHKK